MLFIGALVIFLLPQSTFANGGYNQYYNSHHPQQNYNYNQQYYLSPYMTSTQPYPTSQYFYPPYPSDYYSNNYYNDGYNYGNNYYNSQMSVSCTANKPYAMQGEPVTWSVYASGGRVYNYLWNGTDNPMSLNASSINVSYGNYGIKSMSVTVWSSGGQSTTAYCGQVNVGVYQQYQNPYYNSVY